MKICLSTLLSPCVTILWADKGQRWISKLEALVGEPPLAACGMAVFSHSALPRALEVIIDVCKDLSKEGESHSGSSVGGTQETRALHGSSLHLAGTDSIWASLSTRRQLKSQTALTSLEEDSSPLQSAFHIPDFQAALCSHSGLVSRTMGDFTVRFLCSHVRSRTSSHLVPRPRFLYTRPDDQVGA